MTDNGIENIFCIALNKNFAKGKLIRQNIKIYY